MPAVSRKEEVVPPMEFRRALSGTFLFLSMARILAAICIITLLVMDMKAEKSAPKMASSHHSKDSKKNFAAYLPPTDLRLFEVAILLILVAPLAALHLIASINLYRKHELEVPCSAFERQYEYTGLWIIGIVVVSTGTFVFIPDVTNALIVLIPQLFIDCAGIFLVHMLMDKMNENWMNAGWVGGGGDRPLFSTGPKYFWNRVCTPEANDGAVVEPQFV